LKLKRKKQRGEWPNQVRKFCSRSLAESKVLKNSAS
jgi:hypothetical protein